MNDLISQPQPSWHVNPHDHHTASMEQLQVCLAKHFPAPRRLKRKTYLSDEVWQLLEKRHLDAA